MNFNQAAKIARRGKLEYDAFKSLEEMLTAAARAENAVVESQKALTVLKVQIADEQSKMDALVLDYSVRSKGFADKLQQLADTQAATEIADQQSTKSMNEEFARAARAKKYTHEAKLEALDLALDEKRERLAEVEAKLAEAEEAVEMLKQKFTR